MAKAVGKSGGRDKISERKSGAIKPTDAPHAPPQEKPQRSTGICMRQSVFPSAISFPVRNGSNMQRASEMPEKVSFLIFLLFILLHKRGKKLEQDALYA